MFKPLEVGKSKDKNVKGQVREGLSYQAERFKLFPGTWGPFSIRNRAQAFALVAFLFYSQVPVPRLQIPWKRQCPF